MATKNKTSIEIVSPHLEVMLEIGVLGSFSREKKEEVFNHFLMETNKSLFDLVPEIFVKIVPKFSDSGKISLLWISRPVPPLLLDIVVKTIGETCGLLLRTEKDSSLVTA